MYFIKSTNASFWDNSRNLRLQLKNVQFPKRQNTSMTRAFPKMVVIYVCNSSIMSQFLKAIPRVRLKYYASVYEGK